MTKGLSDEFRLILDEDVPYCLSTVCVGQSSIGRRPETRELRVCVPHSMDESTTPQWIGR